MLKSFNYLNSIFIISILIISVFFWQIKIYDFQFRILILFLFILNLIFFKKKDFKYIFFSFLLILFLVLHLVFAVNFNLSSLNKKDFFSILFLFLLSITVFKNYILILEKLKTTIIVYAFLSNIIFILSLSLIDFSLPRELERDIFASCNLFSFKNHLFYLFFSEPSHFAMISGPVSLYLIYNLVNFSFYEKINSLFFVVCSFLFFMSTTLVFSQICSILFFLLFFLRGKQTFILYKNLLIYLVLLTCLFLSVKQCSVRVFLINKANSIIYENEQYQEKEIDNLIYEQKKIDEFIDKLNSPLVYNDENELSILHKEFCLSLNKQSELYNLVCKKKIDKISDNINILIRKLNNHSLANRSIPLTTEVFMNSLNVAFYTLKNKIIGYGFQRYEIGFYDFLKTKKISKNFQGSIDLNYNDGSSNFTKILTEFGWLFTFFIVLIFYFMRLNNVSISIKLFLISVIITQCIRGAGYFNGGFLFFSLIIFSSIFFKYDKILNR